MDEIQPLLGRIDEPRPTSANPLVDFDPNGDPDNPLEWPKAYKRGVVFLLALLSFTVTFTCIGIVPVAERIIFDLEGRESKSASILLVTVWELGEACGPLLIAPLSEIYGRYPTFNVANIIFIFGIVLTASSPTTGLLVFSRFLTGVAVASNVLNPAIIGDIFPSESRGSGMSLIMLAPLLGGAVGPAISGLIAESLGWRKILWMSAILAIVCEVLFFTLLRETYKVSILKHRATRLRKENQDESIKCPYESDEAASALYWSALRTSIKRPIVVMLDSSVLQILAFYGGLMFTLYYVLATTLPGILMEIYGFSPAQTGLSFMTFSLGATFGILLSNSFVDRIYIKLGKSYGGGTAIPEYRLPFMIMGAVLMPLVVALYGWGPDAHWPVHLLLIIVAFLGVVLLMTSIALTSYVVDAFGIYSASAMTIVLIARCLGGTLLPLAIPPLTSALGLGYGFMFLGAICLVLIPLPVAVMRYGRRLRQHSVYTKDVI
ncbi:MFS general substrate transporter [Hyaloscypha variabilis F]|uniref:MFS general substrate transporter n=1 Tax=Hyaloscypha variabilis (strain UAMH 11265 / GT02V1 / F) TaxID=1149755 RepID=A0A2J6RQX7_HYAVF|nr:MFS general substrate transporter [Hyaloscypha variabilis F]